MNALEASRVAILIVGFRNHDDVQTCISALARSSEEPPFDIFVCENGGIEAFRRLRDALSGPEGPCSPINGELERSFGSPSDRLVEIECFALNRRTSRVWIGCAEHNLGYAGAVNVWIQRLLLVRQFRGFWILNPDADPEPPALQALVERSRAANKGMVGSTIVSSENRDYVYCRAGHHWRRSRTSLTLIGLGEPLSARTDPAAIEDTLDSIAGASMYVTRACVEQIGLMDERFFLYYEDADWSFRAKTCGLGYAPNSIVPHRGGTTIGSSSVRGKRSRLSVYLESRNHLHFVRMHCSRYLPVALVFGCAHALLYLLVRSPQNAAAAVQGMLAAIRGETGQPHFHRMSTQAHPHFPAGAKAGG